MEIKNANASHITFWTQISKPKGSKKLLEPQAFPYYKITYDRQYLEFWILHPNIILAENPKIDCKNKMIQLKFKTTHVTRLKPQWKRIKPFEQQICSKIYIANIKLHFQPLINEKIFFLQYDNKIRIWLTSRQHTLNGAERHNQETASKVNKF